jgi:hypothetical protein
VQDVQDTLLDLIISGSCRGLLAKTTSSSFGPRQRIGEAAAQGGGGRWRPGGLRARVEGADYRGAEGDREGGLTTAETNGRRRFFEGAELDRPAARSLGRDDSPAVAR